MRKILVAGIGLALSLASVPAWAAPPPPSVTITFTPGSAALRPGLVEFQPFTTNAPNSTPYVAGVTSPESPLVAGETVSGDVNTYQSDVSGEAIGPNPGEGSFLGILAGSSFAVNFLAPVQAFSFLLGGLDNYNTVTLNLGSGSPIVLNGREIIGLPFSTITNSGETGRVTYDFGNGPGLVSAMFSTTQRSFEIDALASAAPEPATWAMMLLGFGIVGAALRRRRQGAATFA